MNFLGALEEHLFQIVLAIFFVAANAFFVAAEFALVKIRHTRLEILAKKGNPIARLAQSMVNELDAYLSATQLGITLASLGLGWVGEPAFARLLEKVLISSDTHWTPSTIHSVSFTLAFLIISALHIVLGELVPKSVAIQTAEKICLLVAVPLKIFYFIFYPFLWGLNYLSNFVLRIIRFKPAGGAERAHTEEELKLIVEDSFEEGAISPPKRVLLDMAIDFSHKTAQDIMVPEEKMICFYLDKTIHENLHLAKDSEHSRFPLRAQKKGEVLGFVHMKDVIWQLENRDLINLYDLKRPVIFFPPDTKLDAALREFQRKKIHIGIIRSLQGKPLGLITIEDVIEQLVGSIEDEFDQSQ